MNVENEREKRMDGGELVNQEVQRISKEEGRAAMTRMKSEKAVDCYNIHVEVFRCLGERAVDFLTRLLNTILESERTPE